VAGDVTPTHGDKMALDASRPGRLAGLLLVATLVSSLVATSCGGAKTDPRADKHGGDYDGESGLAEAGRPQRGGTLTYGVEADTTDYCLPEAQLAISGMLVVRAVYDTLTVPNATGDYVPYLAKSISHNATYDEWTIGLRQGIKFHDGTALDSTVVKNNLDAYRGKYPGRSPLLFLFVFQNIKDVTTDGPLTVKVTTKVPWVAFPAYLFGGSRVGIMAQSQLDDKKSCATKLVGTGPFEFVKYTRGQGLTAKRNTRYWQTAPDGKPYPYLNGIEFRVTPDYTVRNQGIEAGDLDIMHTTDGEGIAGKLKTLRDSGKANLIVSEVASEPSFFQLNASKPPFDDVRMRKALAMAVDRKNLNDKQNAGVPTVASGPFTNDSIGYLADPGYPHFDVVGAKKLVASYEADGKKAAFNVTCTADPGDQRLCEDIQARAKRAGMAVKIITRDQAALINDAIGKAYQAMSFRNFPGGDPDINYVWWYGKGNPVNFSGYDDPVINRLLDEGRSQPDQGQRKKIYQDINREMGKQAWYLWEWFNPWAVVEQAKVHGHPGTAAAGRRSRQAGRRQDR